MKTQAYYTLHIENSLVKTIQLCVSSAKSYEALDIWSPNPQIEAQQEPIILLLINLTIIYLFN